jgi:hypothetical protein
MAGSMARPLRIDVAGALFVDDAGRLRVLGGAVSEMPDRYGLDVHTLVRIDNHHHLQVRNHPGFAKDC